MKCKPKNREREDYECEREKCVFLRKRGGGSRNDVWGTGGAEVVSEDRRVHHFLEANRRGRGLRFCTPSQGDNHGYGTDRENSANVKRGDKDVPKIGKGANDILKEGEVESEEHKKGWAEGAGRGVGKVVS